MGLLNLPDHHAVISLLFGIVVLISRGQLSALSQTTIHFRHINGQVLIAKSESWRLVPTSVLSTFDQDLAATPMRVTFAATHL
jgi:hypothetical protein